MFRHTDAADVKGRRHLQDDATVADPEGVLGVCLITPPSFKYPRKMK